MDRSDYKENSARAPSPAPAWPRRLLSAAMTAAALLVGFNALVQALNVLAAWWRHVG